MEMQAPPAADTASAPDASLREDVRRLTTDAKAFASAELAYQKARAAYASNQAKAIAALGAGAVVLVYFSLVAAVVGTVIALGPALGPWGAMIAVTLALLILAAICATIARNRVREMKSILSEGDAHGDVG